MNAFKYIVSALGALALVYLGTVFSACRAIVYVDPASALIALGVPLLLLKAGWSFKGMGAAFRNALSDSAGGAELEDARLFFATAFRYLMATGPMAFLLGLIAILGNLADKARLGPNLAVALISMFYAVLTALLVCLPLEAAAKRRLGKVGSPGYRM
ncbi:MAG: hypothetical protein KKA67_05005 [Spirochaetes bacterium]|nr:hypothetical protein [Spirochaetota bacterium]MBU1081691.1 hypothetical protein [Spirochaetota bacterium]